MKYTFGALASVLTGLAFPVLAQTQPPDVITLDAVSVRSERRSAFRVGQNELILDSTLAQSYGQLLSDVLRRYTGLPMRSYGNGMLSSAIIRGLPASRTAVLWHGFPINSSMLGSTDLNLVPIAGLSEVTVQPGAGSSLFGSDAIAGSIALTSKSDWQSGFGGTGRYTGGSFGFNAGQLTARYTNPSRELSLRTTGSLLRNANTFWFRNTSRFGQPREQQQDAAIRQGSFNQDLYYRPTGKLQISLHGWWTHSSRHLQSPMSVRVSDETQEDETVYSLASVEYSHSTWRDKLSIYHQHSSLRYRKPSTGLDEFSREQRTILRYEQDWQSRAVDSFLRWQLQWGTEAARQRASSESYQQFRKQDRLDLYALAAGQWGSRLRSTVHLRQSWTEGYNSPFTPAFGLEYAMPTRKSLLTLKGHLARTYRIPTLNDRFWRPGGNPDLVPESGWSRELTLEQTFRQGPWKKWQLTAYRNTVRNWLEWVPGDTVSYWSARNLASVRAEGLEASTQLQQTTGAFRFLSTLMLQYTRTVSAGQAGRGSRRYQLMYVPRYTGSWFLEMQYRSLRLGIENSYTGRRYTSSDNTFFLPGYWLTDTYAAYTARVNRFRVEGLLRVNNLTNATYQTIQDRAMPGRHYQVSLVFIYP